MCYLAQQSVYSRSDSSCSSSQHLHPLICPPRSKALLLSSAMAPSSSWLHKFCTFSGTQERQRLGSTLEVYPWKTQLEQIPITSNLSFSLSAYLYTYLHSMWLQAVPTVYHSRAAEVPRCPLNQPQRKDFFSGQSSLMPRSIYICVVQLKREWMKSRWQLCNSQRWKHPTERSLVPSEL